MKKYNMTWTGKEAVITESVWASIWSEWGRPQTVICMAWSFRISPMTVCKYKLCFTFLCWTYFDTTWDMVWFPKGLLIVIVSWHCVLHITGTQSEGFWQWFIEINVTCFDIIQHVGILKLQHYWDWMCLQVGRRDGNCTHLGPLEGAITGVDGG